MKFLLSFSIFCFCLQPLLSQEEATDREQLRYLKEVEWPQAYREQDTVLLDRILAAEFEMIDAQGNIYTKNDELEYIKANKPGYESFRFEITRLDLFENGTAIVSGTGHIADRDEKGAYNMTYRSSNVLIKRGDLWKAISSHVSGIQKKYLEAEE